MSLVGFSAQNHRQQVGRRGALDKVDDRRTPESIYGPLNAEFGFTLDVAASADNAKCGHYFTLETDGLARPWIGRVWCNPPYSNIGPWVEKANAERDAEVVVMLLPANRTEQQWWQEHVEPRRRAGEIESRFLPGRPRFDVPAGTYTDPRGNRPPFGWPYADYLRTRHWRTLRIRVLGRFGGRCEECGVAQATQVHHRTYARVGCEDLRDLTPLCDNCHRAEHGGDG